MTSFLLDNLSGLKKIPFRPDKDKRFIKNWRPIFLLNFDTKLLSKCSAERLKNVLPSLISYNQTAYVNSRFISERRILISNVLGISDSLKILLSIDIEKSLDSVLENYAFNQDFLKWIGILLLNQEPCVINGGMTTRYFLLKMAQVEENLVGLYGSFERKKGSQEANFNTLKITKITILKKTPFFNVTKK